jgi:hypothetical protein
MTPQKGFMLSGPQGRHMVLQDVGFSCLDVRVFLGKSFFCLGLFGGEPLVYLIAPTGVAQITNASPEALSCRLGTWAPTGDKVVELRANP